MKHRLSDDDELAFWHLAHHASTDNARRGLCSIHVADGYAWSSDSYRLLCAPVEADWSGSVYRYDGLMGGTVEVHPVDPSMTSKTLANLTKGTHPGGLHLHRHWIDGHLRRWVGRRERYAKEYGDFPPTAAQLAPSSIYSGGPLTLPEPQHSYRGLDVVGGDAPIATVQAPFLAAAAVAVAELSDADGVIVQGGPTKPLVITPAGPFEADRPFALVMPVRADVSNWPRCEP